MASIKLPYNEFRRILREELVRFIKQNPRALLEAYGITAAEANSGGDKRYGIAKGGSNAALDDDWFKSDPEGKSEVKLHEGGKGSTGNTGAPFGKNAGKNRTGAPFAGQDTGKIANADTDKFSFVVGKKPKKPN